MDLRLLNAAGYEWHAGSECLARCGIHGALATDVLALARAGPGRKVAAGRREEGRLGQRRSEVEAEWP